METRIGYTVLELSEWVVSATRTEKEKLQGN